MLEAKNTAVVGYVKQIPRCSEKSINLTNRTRILKAAVRDSQVTDPKTFSYWKSRTLAGSCD